MADIQVANTDADLSGNTVVTEENTYTITGLHTYSRGSNAPFACITGSAYVQYLDVDKLDGQEGAYYLAAANATGTLAVNRGGTGAATFTDGGVLLGSGTSAITATAVLGDGVILIGDASGDPTTLDVGSSSAITILGTIATGVWQGTDVGVAHGGTGASTLADGYVLLGSGTGAITPLDVTADGAILIGDGSGDPTTLDVGSSSGITILGTIATGVWNGTAVTVPYGGTGATSLTDGGLLLGSGTGAVTALGMATNGQIPIGANAGDAQLATLTGTTNEVDITNGSGSITIGLPASVTVTTALTISGTGASSLDVGGGINAGTGDVALVGTDGKINGPLSSTIIDDLSGANLTTLNASNISSGTLANARLPTNVDLGGTLDVTGATTLDSTLTAGALTTTGNATFTSSQINLSNGYGLLWGTTGFNGNASTNALRFDTAGGARLTIDSAGLVSIGNNLAVTGSVSKGSGSFKIDHPLPSKTDTHHLVHSFIEGPRADLIYRGSATLVAGSIIVDLDTAAGMTAGTWVLLCRDPQVFTSNESGWDAMRGSLSGSTLTIECQDAASTDTVSWMVVAERKDQHMYDTDWTDDEGHVIVEPEKPEEPEP